MTSASNARRLFVGDLHGCLAELNELLDRFGFHPGRDRLFSVGDVIGKGPDVPGTLRRLKDLEAQAVLGNHDFALLQAARQIKAGKHPKHRDYPESLGPERDEWIAWISAWPVFLDLPDIIMVHAGLEPGEQDLSAMAPRILMQIRTWDGKGAHLDREGDPPWFECVKPEKTVVFGHWAQRGLIDLPKFKGLDTGCVYGGKLTGWCPEENRFLQVDAKRAYTPIHYH
ncbi:MAG: metallophosphoesterase [Fibrobacteres bacterium]|nr:metallophosphoesterase [Fibrobacterota bacterium]